MVKPLLLVASVAYTFLMVTSTEAVQSSSCSSASSSSSSSSSQAESYAYASDAQFDQQPSCGPPEVYCGVNEIWSDCPVAVCSPKTCDDVGYSVLCPDLGPDGECPVEPGCICKESYVRNHAGICVPMTHCPSCGGDSNAVFGYRNKRLCSNYNKKPKCTPGYFYNNCECRLGFVYDEIIRKCVFPSECTCMNCDKENEVYDPCPPPCPFRTCGINDAAIKCVPPLCPGDPNCPPPACRCKDGYYRDDLGECVLWEQCPVCEGLNEIYDPCPAPCPHQSCDVNIALILCAEPPTLGDPECEPGCRCIYGHVRNYTGVCIPRDQCPTCPKPNEVYDPCIDPCPKRQCDVDDRLIRCAAPPKPGDKDCVAGCRCADGYYRNHLGFCVTRDECLPKCRGEHEVYSECIQGECYPKTCSELGFSVPCPRIDPKYCKKGCLCEKDYVRDKNGVCIHKTQCPSCGGDCNAIAGCGNCIKHCSDIGKEPIVCTEICYDNVCDCREGMYYDDIIKKCVPPEQCTPRCGANEIYSDCIEDNCRPQNCSQLGFNISCPINDRKNCTEGCLCKNEYARNSEGVCIPVKKCPCCGGDPRAESGCGNHCGNKCSDYFKKDVVCTLECKINGCNCRKGYVYDSNTEQCILPKDCTPVCKKDEVFSDCINGGCTPKNCSQIGLPIPCVKLDYRSCIKGCLCKEGYLREYNGVCVPEKECKPRCNKPNEYYNPCDYNCPPNTCESLDRAYACPIQEGDNCKGRCKCKKGYLRNKNGECITEEQCRKCMGDHEYFSCKGPCDNVCATLHEQNQTNCPIVNKKCTEMCYCEKNYARAKNGTCIPIKDCKEHACGENEVYDNCVNGGCGPRNCSEIDGPILCIDPLKCKGGCTCKKGYLRLDDTGVCVPKDKCPLKCNKPNEYYNPCDYNCPPNTCESLDRAYACPIQEGDNCKGRCKCKKGHLRNKIGECITEEQCRKCMGDHEYYSCRQPCDNVCATLHEQNQTNCPMVNIKCTEMCYCEKNYARAKNGTCIPIKDCKTEICRGKHEVYEDCSNPVCRPKKCSEVGYPLNCTDPPKCTEGCICKNGYVKNSENICIPIKKCPKCKGDKNAESGCGVNCLQKCYDLQHPNKPKPCPKICKDNSCDCRKGHYYDANTDKCVLSSKCTPNCDKDEIPDPCINGGCTIKNCSQLGNPITDIDPKKCIAGCSCKDGYLKSDEGLCIPEEKCPKICNKPNEVYVECPPPPCPPQTCESINKTYHCPLIKTNETDCVGECRCKDGYYRNLIKECISKKNCLKCTGAHEYFSCGPPCDKLCCNQNKTQTKDNLTKDKECVQRCYCEDGYARDDDGDCVRIEDCPAVNTTTAIANLGLGNTKLSIDLLKELLENKPGENIILSAFSIFVSLAQITMGAIGRVLQQLLQLFNLKSKSEIITAFPIIIASLNGLEDVILEVANKYYANEKECPVTGKFQKIAEIFGSEAEDIDFSDNKQAADTINAWVSNQTRGLIDDIAKPEMFSPLTRLAIFNVLYFLGNWVKQFDPKKTKPQDFYLNDKDTKQLPTMTQLNTFEYGENDELDAKMIALPYKGNTCELVICLPNKKDGLKDLLEKLDPDNLAKFRESLTYEKCNVSIPLMNIAYDFSDLKAALMKLNLTAAFEDSDDFKGILQNDEPLVITDIVQKAIIKINELGTEAAAVTGIIVGTTAVQRPPQIKQFQWDRPGAFFLSCSNTLLFSGAYVGA